MKKLTGFMLFLLMPLIASAWYPSAVDVTNIINSFGFLTTIPPNTNGIPPGMVTNNAPADIAVTNAGVFSIVRSNSIYSSNLFGGNLTVTNTAIVSNLVVSGKMTGSGIWLTNVATTNLSGSTLNTGFFFNSQGVDVMTFNSAGTFFGAMGNPSAQVWGFGHAGGSIPLSAGWTPDLLWYPGGAYVAGVFQVQSNLTAYNGAFTNNVSVGGTVSEAVVTAGAETVTNNSIIQGGLTVKNLQVTNPPIFLAGLITNGYMVFSSTTNIQVPTLDTNHIWVATQTNRPGYIFILSNTTWMPK